MAVAALDRTIYLMCGARPDQRYEQTPCAAVTAFDTTSRQYISCAPVPVPLDPSLITLPRPMPVARGLSRTSKTESVPTGSGGLAYASASVFNGRIVLTGGYYQTASGFAQSNRAYSYEAKVDRWKPLPGVLVHGRSQHATVVLNDQLMVFGGCGDSPNARTGVIPKVAVDVSQTLEVYDEEVGVWKVHSGKMKFGHIPVVGVALTYSDRVWRPVPLPLPITIACDLLVPGIAICFISIIFYCCFGCLCSSQSVGAIRWCFELICFLVQYCVGLIFVSVLSRSPSLCQMLEIRGQNQALIELISRLIEGRDTKVSSQPPPQPPGIEVGEGMRGYDWDGTFWLIHSASATTESDSGGGDGSGGGSGGASGGSDILVHIHCPAWKWIAEAGAREALQVRYGRLLLPQSRSGFEVSLRFNPIPLQSADKQTRGNNPRTSRF